VVIPRSPKDLFNGSEPKDDAQFLPFVQDSELAGILNALFKVDVPPNPRNDLVQVFLKGVPKLNEKGVPCEYLRLNMAVPPSAQPNRLGVLAGQNDGFPNGRRLGDDVVDLVPRVVAGVLDPKYNVAPNNQLGDTVVANEKPFLASFPYVASPHDGVSGNSTEQRPGFMAAPRASFIVSAAHVRHSRAHEVGLLIQSACGPSTLLDPRVRGDDGHFATASFAGMTEQMSSGRHDEQGTPRGSDLGAAPGSDRRDRVCHLGRSRSARRVRPGMKRAARLLHPRNVRL
jgi:uncharacterized protein DUF4331